MFQKKKFLRNYVITQRGLRFTLQTSDMVIKFTKLKYDSRNVVAITERPSVVSAQTIEKKGRPQVIETFELRGI